MVSKPWAWRSVRGKPSRMYPLRQSFPSRRSWMMPMSSSSGTRLPFSMRGPTCRPRSVPAAMASRSMSPVETRGTLPHAARRAAWVPLPAPGGPRKITRSRGAGRTSGLASTTDPPALAGAAEAVVVPHDELGLDLGHGVHGHPHDDEQRRAAEVEVQVQALGDPPQVVLVQEGVEGRADDGDRGDLDPRDQELGQDGHQGQVDRAPEGDAAEDVVQVFGGALARPDAGDEPAVLPHVLRHVVGVEDDGGVE